ncbi:MAG: DUF2608 domain-containing protein [Janthinobacterium lividum]
MAKVKFSNKRFLYIITVLPYLSLFFGISQASIETLPSFKNFSVNPTEFNDDTLVIFDVDDVLLMEEDQILRGNSKAKSYLKSLFAQFDKEFGPLNLEQWDDLKSKILLSSKHRVVEDDVVHLIKKMQTIGAKVIVLTACQTGACGPIESLPEWRIKELKRYGMDFEQAFPKINNLSLQATDFKKDKKPLFKSGCLFSTGYAKGLVLKHFLDHLKEVYPEWHPNKVIFFDNQEDNLQSVETIMKDLNICYKGFLYTFAENSSVDLKLGEFQLHHLFKHKKWLTDDEVLLNK